MSELNYVNGKDGQSAYEIAVKNGFKGTEKEWLNSFTSKNCVKSNKGTEFPANPNIGDYFTVYDEAGIMQYVSQFDGVQWVIVYEHKVNFDVVLTEGFDLGADPMETLSRYISPPKFIKNLSLNKNNLKFHFEETITMRHMIDIWRDSYLPIVKINNINNAVHLSYLVINTDYYENQDFDFSPYSINYIFIGRNAKYGKKLPLFYFPTILKVKSKEVSCTD